MKADKGVIWETLLSCCSVDGSVEIAKMVMETICLLNWNHSTMGTICSCRTFMRPRGNGICSTCTPTAVQSTTLACSSPPYPPITELSIVDSACELFDEMPERLYGPSPVTLSSLLLGIIGCSASAQCLAARSLALRDFTARNHWDFTPVRGRTHNNHISHYFLKKGGGVLQRFSAGGDRDHHPRFVEPERGPKQKEQAAIPIVHRKAARTPAQVPRRRRGLLKNQVFGVCTILATTMGPRQSRARDMEGGRRWEELGADCLANVFERLDIEDLTLGVPFVCKSWYKASLNPSCWKVLSFKDLELFPWKRNFNARFEQAYNLRSFSFTGLFKFAVHRSRRSVIDLCFPKNPLATLGDLVYASNECPGLKILTFPPLKPQDEPHLSALVGKWKHLEVLEMGLKPFSFIEILQQINQHCESFIGLQLFGCISHEDALAITTLLPKLKYLKLRKSYLHKEELLMILHGCKELDLLDVAMSRGFNVDDEILKKASSLKFFEYEGTKLEEDYGEDYDEYDDFHWQLVFGDY